MSAKPSRQFTEPSIWASPSSTPPTCMARSPTKCWWARRSPSNATESSSPPSLATCVRRMASSWAKTVAPSTSGPPATHHCSDSASITSICTTSIASTAPCRSKTPLARWRTWCTPARSATSGCPRPRRRRSVAPTPFTRSARCRPSTRCGAAIPKTRSFLPAASWGSGSCPTVPSVVAGSPARSRSPRILRRTTGATTTRAFRGKTSRRTWTS